jgi:hypothetical protein
MKVPNTLAMQAPVTAAAVPTFGCASLHRFLPVSGLWHAIGLCMMHCKNFWLREYTLWPLKPLIELQET